MPTGADAFQRKQAAKEQQRAAQGGSYIQADRFKIKGGTYAVVRFLEQGEEMTFADSHRVPVGRRYPADMLCLDAEDDGTPCPGCMSEVPEIRKRTTKGYMNLIWRDGPVYERNEYGSPRKVEGSTELSITGRADGVFLWICSATVYQELIEKDSKYRGLMSRDFEVKRIGSTMQDTKYTIDPAEVDSGPQPMMIADWTLSEKKYNLQQIITPMSFNDFKLAMQGAPATDGPQPTMERSALATPASADAVFNQGQAVRASAFTRG